MRLLARCAVSGGAALGAGAAVLAAVLGLAPGVVSLFGHTMDDSTLLTLAFSLTGSVIVVVAQLSWRLAPRLPRLFRRTRTSAGQTAGSVFICYRHDPDAAYAERLADEMRRRDLPAWLDRGMSSGDRWDSVLRDRIRDCAVMVVVMTPEAERSNWVKNEVLEALKLDKPIRPLLLRGRPFFGLGHLQYTDVTDGRLPGAEFFARLAETIGGPAAAGTWAAGTGAAGTTAAGTGAQLPVPETSADAAAEHPAAEPTPPPDAHSVLAEAAPGEATPLQTGSAPARRPEERLVPPDGPPVEPQASRRRALLMLAGTALVVAVAIVAAFTVWPFADRGSHTGGPDPSPTMSRSTPPVTVRLAFLDDITGKGYKMSTRPALNAVTLAVDEYNSRGPVNRVQLVPLDAGTWQQEILATHGGGIDAVFGPFTTAGTREMLPVVEAGGIPSITVSASEPALHDSGFHRWHRLSADDDEQIRALADYLTRTYHPRTVFTVDYGDDTAYFAGQLASRMKAAGAHDAAQDRMAKGGKDIGALVSRIKDYRPDVVVQFGEGADVAALAKRLRAAGVTVPFATGENVLLDSGFRSAGGYFTGAVVASSFVVVPDPDNPALVAFTARYQLRFHEAPGAYAAEAYDAANAILSAVAAGKTGAADINAYLAGEVFVGVSRAVQFQPTGENMAKPVFFVKATGGGLTALGES